MKLCEGSSLKATNCLLHLMFDIKKKYGYYTALKLCLSSAQWQYLKEKLIFIPYKRSVLSTDLTQLFYQVGKPCQILPHQDC